MKYDFDAIVVGARCAGASTALLQARRSVRHNPRAATALILTRYDRLPQPDFDTIEYALAG